MKLNPALPLGVLVLFGTGLACRKPETAPAVDRSAEEAKARIAEEARQKTEAEARRQRQEEAAREAAAPEAAAKADEARRMAVTAAEALKKASEAALGNIHFEYDQDAIREEDKPILQAIADFLVKFPAVALRIEGNCDERGTVEYNLALGEKRAAAARDFLKGLGVPAARLSILSYGKERPMVAGRNEESFLQNRRDEFKVQGR